MLCIYHGRISLPFTLSMFSRRAKPVQRNNSHALISIKSSQIHYEIIHIDTNISTFKSYDMKHVISMYLVSLNWKRWQTSIPNPRSQYKQCCWKNKEQQGSSILLQSNIIVCKLLKLFLLDTLCSQDGESSHMR